MPTAAPAATSTASPQPSPPRRPRRNRVGAVSLLIAVGGAAGCYVAGRYGLVSSPWLRLAGAGFEAAMVGGLADWFAVTALFRHPLGLPIPHTAILRARRVKIVEGIVAMVEEEWLSPAIIAARLRAWEPSRFVREWLGDAAHVERLGAPLRDVLRGVARVLTTDEVVTFVERALRDELRRVPIGAAAGQWLCRIADADTAAVAFDGAARSLVNLMRRPGTAQALQDWLDRSARQLRREGKRLIPLILRRRIVQRKLVEAACDYAIAELEAAAADREHALRRWAFGGVRRFGERLANGDPEALQQVERWQAAFAESLESRPLLLDLLARLRAQLEQQLAAPHGELARLIDRELRDGILDLLDDPARQDAFDGWVRQTAGDLVRRHHHQIGITVRENLEALDTDTLVARIEERVGGDLQFIRLNGALVGGLIGILIHLAHRLLG